MRELPPRNFVRLTLLILLTMSCNPFYDEGARFANQVADFAISFRQSSATQAVFDYSPKYGVNQKVRYVIGVIHWCPQPPCDNGAASVYVEQGKSGTGYRISRAASVPRPLQIEKEGESVHVSMRKVNGEVEIVGLR